MRRTLGILLTVVTEGSELLCLATAAMWVRSYWRYDAAYADRVSGTEQRLVRRSAHARSSRGMVSLHYAYEDATREMTKPIDRPKLGRGWDAQVRVASPALPLPFPKQGRSFGIFFVSNNAQAHPAQAFARRTLIVPHWVLVASLAVLPVGRWLRARRRRRLRLAGCCRNCGYDLRATPDR